MAEYIVALIAAFARRYSMTETEAYQYLHRYGAISVAHEYYDVMLPQSFNDGRTMEIFFLRLLNNIYLFNI